jgi:agmatinase
VEESDSAPDWIIYGAPFDGGVTYRPGARFGPRAIRAESAYLKRYHIPFDVDVCEVLTLADGGDAPVKPYSCEQNRQAILGFAQELKRRGSPRLLALGGDHSTTDAAVRAAAGGGQRPLGLAVLDSHLDTVPQVWGDGFGHASFLRNLIEDGVVEPSLTVVAGVKGPLNTKADLAYLAERGATVVHREAGVDAMMQAMRGLVARAEGTPLYVSVDVDVVDPAFAPGTGTPSIGGISSAELLGVLRALRGATLAGGDVVEVLPDRDVSGITALLAAHVAFEILALDADRRRGA